MSLGDVPGFVDVAIGQRRHQCRMLLDRVVLVLGEHPEEIRRHHPDGLANLRHQPPRMGCPVDFAVELPVRVDDAAFAGVRLDAAASSRNRVMPSSVTRCAAHAAA